MPFRGSPWRFISTGNAVARLRSATTPLSLSTHTALAATRRAAQASSRPVFMRAFFVTAVVSLGLFIAQDIRSAEPANDTAAAGPVPSAAAPATAPAERAPAAPKPRVPATTIAPKPPAETLAWRQLRETIGRERAIWARVEAHPDDDDTQKRAQAEFRDVITAYENILRASPDFAEAYAAYGLLLSRVGDRANATKAFLRANKLNPNLPMVKNQLGNILLEDGNYKEALAYYLSAIELKDDEPLYHYQLGSLLTEFRGFFIDDGIFDRPTLDSKMQTAFRRAAELAPENWAYCYRYAESFADLDKPDWTQALAEWQKLETKAKPGLERETVLLQEANVLLKLDRKDEARALIDEVSEPILATNKQKLLAQMGEEPAAKTQ
jgi:cytochrome c-type biogenesis protein CcmH/NrfG